MCTLAKAAQTRAHCQVQRAYPCQPHARAGASPSARSPRVPPPISSNHFVKGPGKRPFATQSWSLASSAGHSGKGREDEAGDPSYRRDLREALRPRPVGVRACAKQREPPLHLRHRRACRAGATERGGAAPALRTTSTWVFGQCPHGSQGRVDRGKRALKHGRAPKSPTPHP